MLVGHFAVAFAGKRLEPKLGLGTLAFAAMLPDLLWAALLMAGVERMVYRPGRGAAQYVDFASSRIDISHSLLMDVIWAAALCAIYFFLRRYRRGAWILFAAVLSHWILDIVTDRGIPLAPGTSARLGLNLWSSIPLTCLVEGGLWVAALVLYSSVARPRNRTGTYAFWIGTVLLTLVWYNNIAGPPPPDPRIAPFAAFILFVVAIAWSWWIDKLRPIGASATTAKGAGAQGQ